MSERGFDYIDHTADKGILAKGSSHAELFRNAALGMFSLMADLPRYQPDQETPIEVQSDNLELTLKAWLDELLFNFEVDQILFLDFKILEVDNTHVKALARGIPFSPDIEWLGAVVKAVTYHDLKIWKETETWYASVILDV